MILLIVPNLQFLSNNLGCIMIVVVEDGMRGEDSVTVRHGTKVEDCVMVDGMGEDAMMAE